MKNYSAPITITRSDVYDVVSRTINDLYSENDDVSTVKKYIDYIESNKKFFSVFDFDKFEKGYEGVNPKSYVADAERLFAYAYDAVIGDHDLCSADGEKLHEGRETRWNNYTRDPEYLKEIASYFKVLSTYPYNTCKRYLDTLYFGDLSLDCVVLVIKEHGNDCAESISIDITCGNSKIILKVRYDYMTWSYSLEERYGRTLIEPIRI